MYIGIKNTGFYAIKSSKKPFGLYGILARDKPVFIFLYISKNDTLFLHKSTVG